MRKKKLLKRIKELEKLNADFISDIYNIIEKPESLETQLLIMDYNIIRLMVKDAAEEIMKKNKLVKTN